MGDSNNKKINKFKRKVVKETLNNIYRRNSILNKVLFFLQRYFPKLGNSLIRFFLKR